MLPVGRSIRTLLPDANVLLLFLVGNWKRSRIEKFKNTAMFTESDFDLFVDLLEGFGRVATTTHILTEVSNLTGQHGEPERAELFRALADLIPVMTESYATGVEVAVSPVFVRLGLTDAAIASIASRDTLEVLTTDLDLWVHLTHIGVPAHNFNHIRQSNLLP